MFIDYTEYLTHTADLYRAVNDQYGQPVAPSNPTEVGIACFAYFGPSMETFGGYGGSPAAFQESWNRWFVLLDPDAELDEQDEIRNITDQFGNLVFAGGKVDALARYNHWEHGPQIIKATIGEV